MVLITKWFIGGKLNLAYAVNGIAVGFAGMAAGVTSPLVFGTIEHPHLGKCLFTGFWINFICTIFMVPTLYMDWKDDVQLKALEID